MNDDHSRTESADDSAPQTENTAGIPEPSGEEPENNAGNREVSPEKVIRESDVVSRQRNNAVIKSRRASKTENVTGVILHRSKHHRTGDGFTSATFDETFT